MAGDRTPLLVPLDVALGQRVRLARIAARLSREVLAAGLGISLRTLDRVESGSRGLRRGELAALVRLTGQKVEFFGASFEEGTEGGVLPPPLPLDNEEER